VLSTLVCRCFGIGDGNRYILKRNWVWISFGVGLMNENLLFGDGQVFWYWGIGSVGQEYGMLELV